MKVSLRLFGLVGFLLFSSIFAMTFSTPEFIERIGKEFIQNKILEKTKEKVDSISATHKNSKLGKLVGKLIKKNEVAINSYKEKLTSKAHEKIADIVAEMSDLTCECRDKYAKTLESNYKFNVLSLSLANEKLTTFMKSKYMEVATKLKKDFRIFTGVNAFVFLFLILISFMKPKAVIHLYLPAALLFAASMVSSYFYLFEQNWFFTIVYGSYVGWAYLVYLGLVFLFLCDITFNKGRVTTTILEGFFNAIGNVTIIAPC